MVDFFFYYILVIILLGLIAGVISAWKEPTSLVNSAKECANFIGSALAGIVVYNLVFKRLDVIIWKLLEYFLILVAASIFRLAIDWWLIRRRLQREAL